MEAISLDRPIKLLTKLLFCKNCEVNSEIADAFYRVIHLPPFCSLLAVIRYLIASTFDLYIEVWPLHQLASSTSCLVGRVTMSSN